jgi:hypothetical protein
MSTEDTQKLKFRFGTLKTGDDARTEPPPPALTPARKSVDGSTNLGLNGLSHGSGVYWTLSYTVIESSLWIDI